MGERGQGDDRPVAGGTRLMAVLTFASAKGAPGVTTSVLALAFAWHRPALVVEAGGLEIREHPREGTPGGRERRRLRRVGDAR